MIFPRVRSLRANVFNTDWIETVNENFVLGRTKPVKVSYKKYTGPVPTTI